MSVYIIINDKYKIESVCPICWLPQELLVPSSALRTSLNLHLHSLIAVAPRPSLEVKTNLLIVHSPANLDSVNPCL